MGGYYGIKRKKENHRQKAFGKTGRNPGAAVQEPRRSTPRGGCCRWAKRTRVCAASGPSPDEARGPRVAGAGQRVIICQSQRRRKSRIVDILRSAILSRFAHPKNAATKSEPPLLLLDRVCRAIFYKLSGKGWPAMDSPRRKAGKKGTTGDNRAA